MDGWMDERMNEWMDEWMNGWMDEWMNEWMNGLMSGWINEMNGWMVWRIDTYACTCTHRLFNCKMIEWMN